MKKVISILSVCLIILLLNNQTTISQIRPNDQLAYSDAPNRVKGHEICWLENTSPPQASSTRVCCLSDGTEVCTTTYCPAGSYAGGGCETKPPAKE